MEFLLKFLLNSRIRPDIIRKNWYNKFIFKIKSLIFFIGSVSVLFEKNQMTIIQLLLLKVRYIATDNAVV